MTCTDINTLTRQKELLLQKLSTFEETNRTLRDLLREQHCKEVSSRLWPPLCPAAPQARALGATVPRSYGPLRSGTESTFWSTSCLAFKKLVFNIFI